MDHSVIMLSLLVTLKGKVLKDINLKEISL